MFCSPNTHTNITQKARFSIRLRKTHCPPEVCCSQGGQVVSRSCLPPPQTAGPAPPLLRHNKLQFCQQRKGTLTLGPVCRLPGLGAPSLAPSDPAQQLQIAEVPRPVGPHGAPPLRQALGRAGRRGRRGSRRRRGGMGRPGARGLLLLAAFLGLCGPRGGLGGTRPNFPSPSRGGPSLAVLRGEGGRPAGAGIGSEAERAGRAGRAGASGARGPQAPGPPADGRMRRGPAHRLARGRLLPTPSPSLGPTSSR